MDWIAMAERHPTAADRDENGYVWCWCPEYGQPEPMGGIVSAATHWLPGTLTMPTQPPDKVHDDIRAAARRVLASKPRSNDGGLTWFDPLDPADARMLAEFVLR